MFLTSVIDNKLLTIVIPAYNAEKVLPRCLNSLIIDEILDCVEVLIINDGSMDKTSNLAQEYELKYPHFFHVINKDNGNYGSVMNVGLSLAKGKYFRTLDSDDWVKKDGMIKLISSLKETEADLILTKRIKYYQNNGQEVVCPFDSSLSFDKDICIDETLLDNNSVLSSMVVMSMCYKTSLLRQCSFKWSERVFYSDNEYCYFPMKQVQTIRLVNVPFYVYFIGDDIQSTSEVSLRKNFQSFNVVANRIVEDYLSDYKKYPTQKILDKVIFRVLRYFYSYIYIDGRSRRKEILHLDRKFKNFGSIYQEVGERFKYAGINVIEAYRISLFHPKFLFALLLKQTLENNTIRRLVGLKKKYKGIA